MEFVILCINVEVCEKRKEYSTDTNNEQFLSIQESLEDLPGN